MRLLSTEPSTTNGPIACLFQHEQKQSIVEAVLAGLVHRATLFPRGSSTGEGDGARGSFLIHRDIVPRTLSTSSMYGNPPCKEPSPKDPCGAFLYSMVFPYW